MRERGGSGPERRLATGRFTLTRVFSVGMTASLGAWAEDRAEELLVTLTCANTWSRDLLLCAQGVLHGHAPPGQGLCSGPRRNASPTSSLNVLVCPLENGKI